MASQTVPVADRRLLRLEMLFLLQRQRWQRICAQQDAFIIAGREPQAAALNGRLDRAVGRSLATYDRLIRTPPTGLVGIAVILRALLDRWAGLPAGGDAEHHAAMLRVLQAVEREGGRPALPCGLPQPLGPGPGSEDLPEVRDPDGGGTLVDLAGRLSGRIV